MTSQEYNPNTFFGRYEQLIRKEIGGELDNFKKLLHQASMDCMVKLMNIKSSEKGLTVDDLLGCSSEQRCSTISAILCREALSRLESTYLMISVGLLSNAYASLRQSLEALIKAFVVGRVDSEAQKFLRNEDINPKLAEKFLLPEVNKEIINMRKTFSNWGVHTKFESVQLTSLFGPSLFDRVASEVHKVNRPIELPDGFVEAASECIKHGEQLAVWYIWFLKKPLPTNL